MMKLKRRDGGGSVQTVRTPPIKLSGGIGVWMKTNPGQVHLADLYDGGGDISLGNSKIVYFGDPGKDKGVYAVYRYAVPTQDNIRNADKNCVGPAVWYNMSQAQARAVCVQGHL